MAQLFTSRLKLLYGKPSSGQSLAEILIGVTVGAIIIGAVAVLVSVTLRSSTQNKYYQAASFLRQELIDLVTVFAESKWNCVTTPTCGIYNLNPKNSSGRFWISTAVIPPIVVAGEEQVTVNGLVYNRYFYVSNVSRDALGFIEASYNVLNDDPSTQKITVVVYWNSGASQVSASKILTRSRNNQVLIQTDWSGGPKTPQEPVYFASATTTDFVTATANIDYSAPGFLKLIGASGNLTSDIFDTCQGNGDCGAGYNTIMWQGTLTSGTVQVQLASDCLPGKGTPPNCTAGAADWDFIGPNGSGTYYLLSAGAPLKIVNAHQNKRYIRYKVFLTGNATSPVVNDIIINWNP